MNENLYCEYRVETLGNAWKNPKPDDIRDTLNQWGREGWEVICISHTPGGAVTVVAKQIVGSSERNKRSGILNYE